MTKPPMSLHQQPSPQPYSHELSRTFTTIKRGAPPQQKTKKDEIKKERRMRCKNRGGDWGEKRNEQVVRMEERLLKAKRKGNG